MAKARVWQRVSLGMVFSVLAQGAIIQGVMAQDNVPWADLMVNLPEADMDAYAQQYLEQSIAPAKQPTTASSPSHLDINEVVLHKEQWIDELNRQADLALSHNNWPLAELRLAQVLAEFSDAHDTRLRLASLLYGRGALGQTRALLQEGIELSPTNPELRLILARLLAEQQRYLAAYEQLTHLQPAMASHLDYYSLKAELERRSAQCEQASQTYQQLLSHASVGAWWLGLGLCQRELGQDFSYAFEQARASADLGVASQRFVELQLQQVAK
ncbi:tetratricopeptide repeat protein [Oceanisphaera avium]|uniref:Tetratricopeptide repeat protein n=1 Tax=Oceanisphaera avium TaxID=1903694 RepID=A0A1Y0CVB0_9GAMM|nr:tetratricopeptide repeat protein [Oceanisphaera avium]ART79242.1 hypothetical protein CBP12_03015 [Oceanisphaera avium]